jgi:hypothetical protein
MSTPNAIKKNIAKDWIEAFPELSIYAQNKFYKIIGSVITGIELIALPFSEDYRPHFVICPLWEKDASKSIEYPGMMIEFKNRDGLQLNISYSNHSANFEEAVECVRHQLPINFTGNIHLGELLTVLMNYSVTSHLSASPNSLLQGRLYQFMLYCALYTNNAEQINRLLTEIKQRKWNIEHFGMAHVDPDVWITDLENTVHNHDEFMAQITRNKEDKKIKKLKQSQLLP